MLEELKKNIHKEEIFGFLMLIVYFTCIMTPMMFHIFAFSPYVFEPDYRIHKVIFRDQINSIQMLESIINNDEIKKEFSPQIGDFIGHKDGVLHVTPRKEILHQYEVYVLDNITKTGQFEFSSNTVAIFRDSMIVEQIKDFDTVKKIQKNKHLFNTDTATIQIGSFVWKNPNGKYYIIRDNKFHLKEHLYDSSLNGLLNITDIKKTLENSYIKDSR